MGVMGLEDLEARIRRLPPGDLMGRVSKVVGLVVESRGPEGSVGEQMLIHLGDGRRIAAEVEAKPQEGRPIDAKGLAEDLTVLADRAYGQTSLILWAFSGDESE